MLVRSSKTTVKKISFTVQTALLLEAINNTDIALGTSAKPIPIDSFVSINDADFFEFFSGETIDFQLVSDTDSEALKLTLVSCHIYNIGQDFNKRFVTLPNPWQNIFDTTPETILELPDGSLTIKPVKDVCSILVAKGLVDKKINTYVSYKVIIKSTITEKDRDRKEALRTYYFEIDPLIKITSGGRGSGGVFTPKLKYK